ncbi:Zinc ABC transporter, ATP-binding protein ZnuC [Chitinispirillum alkaliphilum]|nr:Zinc ABC transporter, ATP-binding protein ZnuC [Chitinispirillum alkaliphilum]
MNQLEFRNVCLGYGGREILKDVNITVEKGDFFGLVGPNGSGKSTLIKSMLGLVKPRSGSIKWVPSVPRRGYVPQREQVDPIWPMRVQDLLRATIHALGFAFRYRREHAKVTQVMGLIGIDHLANQTLDTLSGGEMQRVLLARALIVDPQILLLDEPTAAMDLVASQKFLSLITHLHETHNITVVIVTHDLPSLIDRAHRLAIIQHGQLHSGTSEEILTSENLTRIYREPLKVSKVEGRTVIYPVSESEGGGMCSQH